MIPLRRAATYAGIGVLGLVVLVVVGVAVGVLGAPSVDGVENQFAAVDDATTTIDTNLTVTNPNPIGVSLGGLSVDYAIEMNDVAMAAGHKEGLSLDTGTTEIPFRTQMNNTRIPAWWFTHVSNGETTSVYVDVAVSHGLLGGNDISLPQEQTIETDIVGQFNDSTTRPIAANQPVVSDPVLFINETSATYGENVTRQETPLDMAFTVYNPKVYPYTVSEIGYTIEMNGVEVGSGTTEDPYAIPGRTETTLEATTVIQNERLDDWWVSHLERDQVTTLTIDFYLLLDPDTTDALGQSVDPIRLDVDQLDHQTTIETDIFGTKDVDGLSGNATAAESTEAAGDGEGTADSGGDATNTDDSTSTESTETTTADGSTNTAPPTETTEETPTQTETTDDGGLLG